jgi:hypothetical protein
VIKNHLIKRLIIAGCDKLTGMSFVEGTHLFQQALKGFATIGDVSKALLERGRSKRMNVKSNTGFRCSTVTVTFQNADLVEGRAEVDASEGLILVEFQAILVIEMERP